jgi:citrate lyase subunit beta/citryl-CoA lyase
MTRFVRRSTMTFPVNIPRFTEKAYIRGADCLIMDLEDSVPLEEKAQARLLIKELIPRVAKGGSDVAVRINKPVYHAVRDLEASIWPGLSCVSIPKVESAGEVKVVDDIITRLETRGMALGSVQIAVVVETSLGVLKGYEIASASPRIITLSVGAEDLSREMGIRLTARGDELNYARQKIIVDAYAAGVQPLGLVGVDPFDWGKPEQFQKAAEYSRSIGFKGAGVIHPAPIPYVNKGFSLPATEVDYARKALAAFEEGLKRGTASVNLEGRMIDIATAERCRIILDRANAIDAMEKRKDEAIKNPSQIEEEIKAAIMKAEEKEKN